MTTLERRRTAAVTSATLIENETPELGENSGLVGGQRKEATHNDSRHQINF